MKFSRHPVYRNRYNRHRIEINTILDNVWVIGDVHGCGDEFEELCQKIKVKTPNKCQIIQLGDLIDRGPHFAEVFETVERHDVKVCMGNHELNFLLEHDGYKKCRSNARLRSHEQFQDLNQEDQDRILSQMKSFVNYITCEVGDIYSGLTMTEECWFLSHSPIKTFEDIYTAGRDMMTNAWSYCARNQPYDEYKVYPHDYFVHGHQHWNYTPIDDQVEEYRQFERNVMNIDGGCVYGGELVAYNLCKNDYISVKAKQIYHD